MTVLAAVIAAVLAAATAYPLGRAHTTPHAPAPDPDTTTAPGMPAPRVTVQVIDDQSPRTTVQAVAEISDGHLTARVTSTEVTDPRGVELPYAPIGTCGAAHIATANAISTARALLRGAQAGYTAETTTHATRTAQTAAERAAAKASA